MDIKKSQLAAVVILYNPTHINLANITSYNDQVQNLMIFDNSEETIHGLKEQLGKWPHTTYYHDGHNQGIAKRLNQACEKALEIGASWLLSMDQDSSFPDNAAEYFFKNFQDYPQREKVAMFGTNYDQKNMLVTSQSNPTAIDTLITSGMLVNLKLYQQIGIFDEALFIDSVDHEYCIRAKMAGYPIICFKNITLKHQIGTMINRASIKSLFLIKKEKSIHSPLRCYYMYRNMLYLENKYKETNPIFSKYLRSLVAPYITKCYLYGRNYKALNLHIKQAKADFKNGKMGKYVGYLHP